MKSGFDPSKIPTLYNSELAGNKVASYMAQILGLKSLPVYKDNSIEIWNSGWKKVDEERMKAINAVIARPKNQGGLYEVGPKSSALAFDPITRLRWK